MLLNMLIIFNMLNMMTVWLPKMLMIVFRCIPKRMNNVVNQFEGSRVRLFQRWRSRKFCDCRISYNYATWNVSYFADTSAMSK
jgi:hypothetical protein